jgi:hypothetical protein
MRLSLLFVFLFLVLQGYAQSPSKIKVSGIVLGTDSVPIQGVAIINVKTGKISRTDKKGYFESEFAVKDSLLIS